MLWEQKFQTIKDDPRLSKQQKVDNVLELGLNFLGLGIGLVSQVKDQVYTVIYAHCPDNIIQPGTTFEVGGTYCSHTLKANESVGFNHAGKSEIVTHPCYQNFKLEAYIGAPISLDGKVVGTVNFSAAAPRDMFTENEFDFINAVANWLDSVVEAPA